jgi:ABC-type lipoprotein release transport system permease subunit
MAWMVVQRGVRYALAGSIVGAALAIMAGRWLSTSSFGIQHAGDLAVVTIAASLIAIAAVASWWPGYQASRIPTLEAMSVE